MKSHLHRHQITGFNSLQEVINFQKSYAEERRRILSLAEVAIEQEKKNLATENPELKNEIESTKAAVAESLQEEIELLRFRLEAMLPLNANNVWQRAIHYFRSLFLKNKIRWREINLPKKVSQSVRYLKEIYEQRENRYLHILTNFEEAVYEHCGAPINELDRKKTAIDEVNNFIYGAIGEQKVVKELEQLSNQYILINDFCLSFNPPIYNRNENDRIRSIQVDHLLIAPSGLFVIETKNWSEESINSLSLHSPVAQLKRASFAVFTVLNNGTASLSLNRHHWGAKKIPVKNVVVLINHKPIEEFQYVKILQLNELLRYIEYFPPIFTRSETERIANELLRLSGIRQN